MATSLAKQLAHISAGSRSSLNVKAQKAAHSKSLIWDPSVAATQGFETVYAACIEGFEELCQLDGRFAPFAATIFSEQSQHEDRTQLSAAESGELDNKVEAFLRLVGARLRLMPAIKSLEWLIRRFRIHEYTTSTLLTTFLPYHSTPAFVTLLSILPARLPNEYRFLAPYAKALQSPPRAIIVRWAVQNSAFLTAFSEYTLETCRARQHYPALVAFWGGIMTEAVNELLDRNRSGRQAVQAANDQAMLHRFAPILGKAMSQKKAPNMQVAAYMALSVFVTKGGLDDAAIAAFMEQLVHGWTADTGRPGLFCLAILAQHRSWKHLPSKVTRSLRKISQIADILAEIGARQRVDNLATGLCLALIDRISRRGDGKGLPVVTKLIGGHVGHVLLHEKQMATVIRSLLEVAARLDGGVDQDGSLRRQTSSALASIRASGSALFDRVLLRSGSSIEDLEMKLDSAIRPDSAAPNPLAAQTDEAVPAVAACVAVTPEAVEASIEQLAASGDRLADGLGADAGSLFAELSRVFVSAVSLQPANAQVQVLSKFSQLPQLTTKSEAPRDFACFACFAFFIRIWCGPYPALVKVAALEMTKERTKSDDGSDSDTQLLIPYCIAALSDPSQRVRRAAANLLASMSMPRNRSSSKATTAEATTKRPGKIYGRADEEGLLMAPETTAKFLASVLVASAEECVMHADHIHAVFQASIDDSKCKSAEPQGDGRAATLSKQARLQIFVSLSKHAILTPLLSAKERLLASLNEVRVVSSTTRTQALLPLLEWWAGLPASEAKQLCDENRVSESTLDERCVGLVVANDRDGLWRLLGVAKRNRADEERPHLTTCAFARLRKLWPSAKANVQTMMAREMLELSQLHRASDRPDLVAAEAAGLLQAVELTTDILHHFLESIHTDVKAATEQPSGKRRKTSSPDSSRGQATEVDAELSATLRRATFVLQLVEGSGPVRHAEIFDSLFSILGELQNFRAVVGSELGYLQNLVLRSLLAILPAYRADKDLSTGGSRGHGDLLVNCIQKSSSPMVQNAALLLIAGLASAAPELVLHSVMPIFTFMGASVLRQSDDYSAHVVNQTIQEVIPPLIASLRKGQQNTVLGAAELLVSFTTAYEHVPAHRKEGLFVSLTETLGARDFLFAVVSMLIDRYGPGAAALNFATELLSRFGVDVQLEALVQITHLVRGLYTKPKAALSTALLGLDDGEKNTHDVAARQLAALPVLLGNRTLKPQFERLAKRDDMEAPRSRELYAALFESILLLSESFKGHNGHNGHKALQGHCGLALASLLNLLAIGEFTKAVETLLDQPNIVLRQKVLRAVELRVERENSNDPQAQAALVAFLPQLTALIRESTDVKFKCTAVACADKIAEKYGRRDVEAVTAAASTIAGGHCLGQTDRGLQIMSLLCLASLADVLREAMVPVLPIVVPEALRYLRSSLGGREPDAELHSASYAFLTALAEHVPYMMMSAYLDELLQISNVSAESGRLGEEAKDARRGCLQLLARQMDAKEFLTALQKDWMAASTAGFEAISEYLEILGLAVGHHSKSAIASNVWLLSRMITDALDLRRQRFLGDGLDETASRRLDKMEQMVYGLTLRMVYKLNDATFRPVLARLMEWTALPPPPLSGHKARDLLLSASSHAHRRFSVYGLLLVFFDSLGSIVTNYGAYVVEDAAKTLRSARVTVPVEKDLWARVLAVLAKCFEHDQDDFWQAPAHFGAIAPVLLEQFLRATALDVSGDLIPAVVALAATVDSQALRKEINSTLLKHLRSEKAEVRLAAVKCQQALTEKLGEEWLASLPEMLPCIGELQDDNDEVVERETHGWIVKIERVLGESLDSMLQ